MSSEITATEAARNFSDLLNRVRHGGESFLVVRNGEAICRIEPAGAAVRPVTVGDLLDTLTRGSRDPSFAEDVEHAQGNQPKLPPSPWPS